jgi:hypothetical protein
MMRTHDETPRREGFALVMALGALVILGTLVAGSAFVVMQETRLGRNQLVQGRAFAAAEFGLNKIQADWDKTPNLQMNNGAMFDTTYMIAGQGSARVRYTRLNNETFWIVSEGRVGIGNATDPKSMAVKRVNAILRLRIPTVRANGAITTSGNINVQGSPTVTGVNAMPPGWIGCDATAANKAGIVAPPGAVVSIQKPNQVVGTPQVLRDSLAADSSTYIRYGDETWNTLQSQANIILPGGTNAGFINPTELNGRCDRNPSNWGEPNRGLGSVAACYNYFPIIYVAGNLQLNHGRGQGILLVDGDVQINGNFFWTGLIVVRDDFNKGNGNATVMGAVMARNANIFDPTTQITGNTTYGYSECALDRAMRGSAQVVQARERAWAELF